MTMLPTAAPFRAGAVLFTTGRFVAAADHVRFSGTVATALAAEREGFDDLWAIGRGASPCA